MEKRILLNLKVRRKIFLKLKKFHGARSNKELAEILNIGYSGFKKWLDGYNHIPLKIFPKTFKLEKFVIDTKDEGWGYKKGGISGIEKLREIYPIAVRRKWSIKGGKNNIKNLAQTRKLVDPKKISFIKIQKRKKIIQERLNHNSSFLSNTNYFPTLVLGKIDAIKNNEIALPKVLDDNLAEEIGIHLGDGSLSKPRNYYSIRGYSRDEYDYYTIHISSLIEKIYGFRPKIFSRGSVCGFEKCSKVLFEFKTQILGLPYGEKSHIIDIPKIITDSKNEKLICAFIRGILDSDGCIWFAKNGTYPRIELESVSKSLIKNLEFYLSVMGFEPCTDKTKTKITLYGIPMLDLWLQKIGTNHPKHKLKIEIWKKFGSCPPRLSYPKLKELSKAPIS